MISSIVLPITDYLVRAFNCFVPCSVLLSLSVPSLINYRRTNDAILLSDHIMTELRNVYSISRRFSAFCTVFFTISPRWSTLSTPTLDLVSTQKNLREDLLLVHLLLAVPKKLMI